MHIDTYTYKYLKFLLLYITFQFYFLVFFTILTQMRLFQKHVFLKVLAVEKYLKYQLIFLNRAI